MVIGTSAGGFRALLRLLGDLSPTFSLPIIIVQHVAPNSDRGCLSVLQEKCHLPISEAEEKTAIRPGQVYLAPADYHLLIEHDKTFSLSIDPKVNFARPAIDVLFESAADTYGTGVIGVILTGANSDGAKGLKKIKEQGGLAIIEDPDSAEISYMPAAAREACLVDHSVPLERMAALLLKITGIQT
jgi:two-component system chemotaxis response regulator CheB